MHCKRANNLMMARLDGHAAEVEVRELEEHLFTCSACQARWEKMCALDQLFRSAPMVSAPSRLHARVRARIDRREQARRAIAGGLALAIGTAALALLTLVPIGFTLLENAGAAPALLIGGVETITQLMNLIDPVTRMPLVLLDRFAASLVIVGLGSLAIAVALNGLWIATMRRLRPVGR